MKRKCVVGCLVVAAVWFSPGCGGKADKGGMPSFASGTPDNESQPVNPTNSLETKLNPKKIDSPKVMKKSNGFLLASDISQFVSEARGDDENKKIIFGTTEFTDKFFEYYIDLLKSKTVHSRTNSTEGAISEIRGYKRNCGTHKLKDKYLKIESEGQPSIRKTLIKAFPSDLAVARRADVPNNLRWFHGNYLKFLKANKDGVRCHSEDEVKEIIAELSNQIQKIKVPN